jgi:hypothetical protein
MASVYGYESALSEGSAFNSRVQNFNDGVLLHNQNLQKAYDLKVKGQKGDVSADVTQKHEDEAFYGFTDGKSAISTAVESVGAVKSIAKDGFTGYVANATSDRLNTIGNTVSRLVQGEPAPPSAAMSVVDKINTRILGAADAGENAAAAGGKIAAEAGETIESSNLASGIIKAGLGKVVGGKLGEAGLSAVSELGGKALGDFAGIKGIADGFENLGEGKNFFSGETTGDKFQEAGAVFDAIGTFAPPLELLGGALTLIGGIDDAVHDLDAVADKKKSDGATLPPPLKTATKVSPVFSSLGLQASAPISAKQAITGSSSF